jgi:hypothetical protein
MVSVEQLLDERRGEIKRSLDRIAVTLNAPLSHTGIDSPWKARLQPIVAAEVARLVERLDTIRGDPPRQFVELATIERRSERIATEALAFVGGISARLAGLDNGVSRLGDELLKAVATPMVQGYQPIAIPSGSEFIDVLSEVIRIRYPGSGIWDLPVVLHEFGHFLVRRLPRHTEPSVHSIIRRERDAAASRGAFAEELWSDTFATYAGGPAYPFAALHRFDPAGAADDELPSHPSAMRRFSAMHRTLGHLQQAWVRTGRFAGSLAEPVGLVTDLWHARLRAAGVQPKANQLDQRSAASLAAEFIDILDRDSPVIRYDDGRLAAAVRLSLEEDNVVMPPGAALIDLLNGAWWARSRAQAQLTDRNIDSITKGIVNVCGGEAHGW